MASSVELEAALNSDEMPDDILPMVWLGIKSIHQNTTSMKEDITKLELRATALEESHKAHDDDIADIQNTVSALKIQVRRSELHQTQLSNEVEELKARSMRDNLIFNFDPEVDAYREAQSEDCVALVHAFHKIY